MTNNYIKTSTSSGSHVFFFNEHDPREILAAHAAALSWEQQFLRPRDDPNKRLSIWRRVNLIQLREVGESP